MFITTTPIESELLAQLPETLYAWRHLPDGPIPTWMKVWELLRPFFYSKGYDLFKMERERPPTRNTTLCPAQDSFGLYGDRSDGFKEQCYAHPLVLGARDSLNRNVIIKLVSKGSEGSHELQVLRLLNSEQLRSDPANSTVPVLEFIEIADWVFAVMPFCDGCEDPPILNADECLEFSEQLLTTLAFMHAHRIAHRDIAWENVLMNHHGKCPPNWILKDDEYIQPDVGEFRSTFPVRYMVMDFGHSLHFSSHLPLSVLTADPFPPKVGRPYMAVEAAYQRHNPFAADVYQTGRLLYSWFYQVVPDIPGYHGLLRDMMAIYPPDRPSMATALERLRQLRAKVPKEILFRKTPMEPLDWWPMIQTPFWSTLFNLLRTRLWHPSFVFVVVKSMAGMGILLRGIGVPARLLPESMNMPFHSDFLVRRRG